MSDNELKRTIINELIYDLPDSFYQSVNKHLGLTRDELIEKLKEIKKELEDYEIK